MSKTDRGFSIRIFLPHGDPEGLRLIEKSNWTGLGLAFNRTAFELAREREEINRTGVYVLVGPSEMSSLPILYVGEGDPVRSRLESHYVNKDFWTWAVFFVAKDGSLNKAHVKHLEYRLIELAQRAKQSNLDNRNTPQPPSLSQAERADCESFLADMRSIFPLLGLSAFETPKAKPRSKTLLYIRAKGIEAQGFETSQGFVVRKGSQAVKEEVPSLHEYARYVVALRGDLRSKGVIEEKGDTYVFAQDYAFKSPSTAAMVIQGRTANGRIDWKDGQDRTLKQLQEIEAQSGGEATQEPSQP